MNNNIVNTEFSILDMINIIRNKKKFLIYSSSVVLILAIVIVYFVIDPQYLSTGTVKTTAKSGGLSGLLSTGGFGELADFADLGGGGGAKELALYENILTSRKCVEEAIIKFNFMEENNYKYIEDAVKDFRGNVLVIDKDKLAGIMVIGAYHKDPAKAKAIAEFLIEKLNSINTELNVVSAKNNREFIQQRFELIKSDLKFAEDSLKKYQDKYGLSPEIKVEVSSKMAFELEASIQSEEVKLDILKKMLSADQPELKSQEEKIKSLKEKMAEMNTGNYEYNNLNMKGSPDIIMNYLRLKRNLEIQNKLLTFILPLFEQSKIEEKRETPTVIVLDNPNMPEKKAKPKRVITILIVFFIYVAISIFVIIAYSRIKNTYLLGTK